LQTANLTTTQVRNFFTNVRKRHWNPLRKGRQPRSFLDVAVMTATEKQTTS
jgi:hypothetical protein